MCTKHLDAQNKNVKAVKIKWRRLWKYDKRKCKYWVMKIHKKTHGHQIYKIHAQVRTHERPARPAEMRVHEPHRGPVLEIGEVHEALRIAQVIVGPRGDRNHENERLQSHHPHGQRESQTSTAVYKTAVWCQSYRRTTSATNQNHARSNKISTCRH